ncbi:MAG: transcriptional regulator MntR [Verrucomicrobiota bacterium]
MNKLSQSIEDYLERIYEMIEEKGYARVSDVADALKVSRPSVSIMVKRLAELGYVNYEKYRGLTLTPDGLEVALRIKRRHVTITQFLTLLELDENVIAKDVEGIEHHISTETLARLEAIIAQWKSDPTSLKNILKRKSR